MDPELDKLELKDKEDERNELIDEFLRDQIHRAISEKVQSYGSKAFLSTDQEENLMILCEKIKNEIFQPLINLKRDINQIKSKIDQNVEPGQIRELIQQVDEKRRKISSKITDLLENTIVYRIYF